MLHLFRFLLRPALLLALVACQTPKPVPGPGLLNYFQPVAPGDTLRFEIAENDTARLGDTIPNALFFTVLGPDLLQEIDYLADSAMATVLGKERFVLDENCDACLVDIREFWFRNQSLLVYDKRKKAFTDRVTVAEWYGGDGGQVLTGSWMLDRNNDGRKDLVRREIQHTMVPGADGDATSVEHESALQLVWKNGRFVEQPLSDTALTVKQFPIRSMW